MNVATPTGTSPPLPRDAIVRVVVDSPLRRSFDYLPSVGAAVVAGMRVWVPFGTRLRVGVVVSLVTQSSVDSSKLKRISSVIDREPTFDMGLLHTLNWAADYYHHPLGEVIATALPKLLREGASLQASAECWSLTGDGREALAGGEPRRALRQRQLLELLGQASPEGHEDGWSAAALDVARPGWREAAKALRERAWVMRGERAVTPSQGPPPVTPVVEPQPEPTAGQHAALAAITAADEGGFHAWLLHGITGSGKTEVYLRLTARQLARRCRVLVLVPEIGLTPQLVGRFAMRFPRATLAVLHSGLTDTERLTAWRSAHSGSADIVIGTRSAVFAPVPQLGLVIVDEEHDSSFKQQEGGFRYSARDLALVRAQREGLPIVLGSATPSLESLHNAASGRLSRLSLPQRTAAAQPPTLRLLDVRGESMHAGLSTTALRGVERHLAADGQVLVYINRRGYAPTLACTACGWVAPCLACDARMTVYRQADRLRCHHCGAERALPRQCPQCGYAVKTVGQGTERIEEVLGDTFPGVGIARLDRDVIRRNEDLHAVVASVASGSARILVGTQMVAKGHDFPALTLVIVLNADHGLFSTDFRAAERLAQTIVQVAGRAGRAERAGEVLIQTEFPEHPLLRNLLEGGYDAFAAAALEERHSAAWPPFSRLAALRASAPQAQTTLEFLQAARAAGETLDAGRVRLLGPAPAAMARRADRHHAQVLLESGERASLHRFLQQWVPVIETLPTARRVRWALDVDPLELF
jgi:primosomal protein N' (replication factor Y)